ncbi:MAG: hypothetical protein KGL13_08315, partial [Gammaproteobacteria bacterium]|nr:hypothetical protein [Gammaproteobacteria bacterium]
MRLPGGCLQVVLLALALLASGLVQAGTCPAPLTSSANPWQDAADWDELAARGYRIGQVHIFVDNVFELSDPQQDTWYARLANKLHIETHPRAIREQLLFKSGDPVDPLIIYESERRLHALLYLRASSIRPENCHDHVVDVNVQVKDAWTLKLDIAFAHIGGQNTLQFEATDDNFLGTGKALSIGHTSDPQRSANLVSYKDPSLFGSYWNLAATYADLSDGHLKYVTAGQPFYADQTPWSVAASFYDQEENLNFYNQGTLAWYTPSTQDQRYLSWAHLLYWDAADSSGMRAGILYNDIDYGYGQLQEQTPGLLPPPALAPRRLAGLGLSWEYFQDQYASFTNMV